MGEVRLGRASGGGPRLGDLLPGLEGRPAWRRQAGRGTVAMEMAGRLGDGVRAGWRGADDQMSPPHLRAGTADAVAP